MWRRSAVMLLLPAAIFAVPAHTAVAQQYPSRPIRIVIPFSPGSASDILARFIGPKLYEAWGQQVVADNRSSAGGTVASGIVAAATPDGHTLMLTSSAFAGRAALYDKLPFDPISDQNQGLPPMILLVCCFNIRQAASARWFVASGRPSGRCGNNWPSVWTRRRSGGGRRQAPR